MRLAHARELTEPLAAGETPPPLSIVAGETLLAAVRALIDLGQQRIVEASL